MLSEQIAPPEERICHCGQPSTGPESVSAQEAVEGFLAVARPRPIWTLVCNVSNLKGLGSYRIVWNITPLDSNPPSRTASAAFAAKAAILRGARFVSDLRRPVRRLGHNRQSDYPELLADLKSPLWTVESVVENSLQFGKVQNLRKACSRLHLVEIPAGQTFSFWKQVGRAKVSAGYARGRELRQGCLIPSVGGGLCQLSNSLYDLALQSGCEIVERHPHSKVVPGSAAEHGRDATVFWNYVDLRFRPRQNILITSTLAKNDLVLRFWGKQRLVLPASGEPAIRKASFINTCTDCGVSECFRHVPSQSSRSYRHTSFLVEECWPEFAEYVSQIKLETDDLFLPCQFSFRTVGRYEWNSKGYRRTVAANAQTLLAMAKSRLIRNSLPPVAAQVERSQALADYYGKRLSIDTSYLYVAQSLLPFLWHRGDLGGRAFSVLMTRPPLQILHQQLDNLVTQFPERKTFQEFRASAWIAEAEAEALEQAEQIITPHLQLANLFAQKSKLLGWKLPAIKNREPGPHIVFPGPALARKGAFEVRDAVKRLDRPVLVLSATVESKDFWSGIQLVSKSDEWLSHAAVVIQPAWIENNPRPLLRALAAGIPVIATPECGIGAHPLLTLVAAGDAKALRDELQRTLSEERGFAVPLLAASHS
ncbi:MAG TPA: VanW family protein [Alphaproteobacteria bacterium]|nr:VanW family protein [Alphaproteobacteria bacterium]